MGRGTSFCPPAAGACAAVGTGIASIINAVKAETDTETAIEFMYPSTPFPVPVSVPTVWCINVQLGKRPFAVLHALLDLGQHVGSFRRRVLVLDAGREPVLVFLHELQDVLERRFALPPWHVRAAAAPAPPPPPPPRPPPPPPPPPHSDGVKVLKRDPDRVHPLVARRARRVRPVLFHLL